MNTALGELPRVTATHAAPPKHLPLIIGDNNTHIGPKTLLVDHPVSVMCAQGCTPIQYFSSRHSTRHPLRVTLSMTAHTNTKLPAQRHSVETGRLAIYASTLTGYALARYTDAPFSEVDPH